jgi:L-alanine-DL-glutamate epimerase-like enolase superfamily enzyme
MEVQGLLGYPQPRSYAAQLSRLTHDPVVSGKKVDIGTALPVSLLAADDCALFMWATYPLMREALATIAAAHVGAASRNFLGLEYHFIETPWIGSFVRRDVPLFRDGRVELTDAPGLGVELDEEVCRQRLAPGETLLT